MALNARYRLDDLRNFGSALASASGIAPARASAFVSQLLWYDAAAASSFGVASLITWLERLERGELNGKAEGKIGFERAATATLDGMNGIPHLILERAGGLAAEKARDVGMGLVRVSGIKALGAAAAVAAELAIGPMVGVVLGPSSSWSLALPGGEGLPLVVDSAWSGYDGSGSGLNGLFSPWSLLLGEGDWLVLAATVPAIEPLASFLERVEAAVKSHKAAPGLLAPDTWDATRREIRELGVPVSAETAERLEIYGHRFGMATPAAVTAQV
jgi:LDH2 family malate/lactate/ureidoglycolate dehydrogenase